MKLTILYAAILPFVWAESCGRYTDVSPTAAPAREMETLRASLEAFSSPALAKNAGYKLPITDCMSNGDEGAMGIHLGNQEFIDGHVDLVHPEALIFEPGANGEMSIVGVEFIVPFTAVSKQSPAPVLMGQKFSPNDVFGVWALHVWTHRSNPRGTFAPWNPRVHC